MNDTNPRDEPKPVTIASLSEGEIARRNFLVFGAGPRQPGDEPRFISTQEEADERFGIGRVTVTKADPPSLYATFIPILSSKVMPRGLYADYPLESAAPSGKEEGPMEWTVEGLAGVVKESEWWQRISAEMPSALRLESFIENADATFWHGGHEPYRDELRAILSDIRTGAIYGSAERCAVCGGKPGGMMFAHHDFPFQCCPRCSSTVETIGVPSAAAAILRARRLLGERKAKDPNPDACAKCGRDSWYDLPAENGGRMRVCAGCHPGVSISLASTPAKPDLTPRERWEAKCERWRMEGHPTPYQFTEPGLREAAAFMTSEELTRECEAIGSNLTETCRKRGITLPPWSDPYAAQRDRESDANFESKMFAVNKRHFAERVRPRWEAYMDSERKAAARRRVLLGLDRGPDPRILLTGDVFDPRGR